jgi:regulator of replication initiation timing
MNDVHLSDVNSIAYNGNLREQLKTLHEMLGLEVTDVASGAMEFGYKFRGDAEKVIKYLSKMASQLSIALQEARRGEKTLTSQEQEDYEKIKALTAVLGNLQDKLNRVIKSTDKINLQNEKLREQGVDLAEHIMQAQDSFRSVRAGINAYGFMSQDPLLAKLFEEESKVSEDTQQTI